MIDTIYIDRPLINGSQLAAYASAIGLTNVLNANDMHVTIAFSRDAVDWSKPIFHPDPLTILIEGGSRTVSRFGDAVVLEIAAPTFSQRWAQLVLAGASWDFPEYRPHVTLAYDSDVDVFDLIAARTSLRFGPERRMPVDLDAM